MNQLLHNEHDAASELPIPSGFKFAARAIIAFDGGNHPLYGNFWSCRSCGTVIMPGDKDAHEMLHTRIDEIRAIVDRLLEAPRGTDTG